MGFFNQRQDLFLFIYGDEKVALTSSNKGLTFKNNEYKSDKFISRSKVVSQGSNNKSPEMTITMSKDSEVASWFKIAAPYKKIELFIYQVEVNDLEKYLVLWSGTVISSKFSDNKVDFECFSKDQMLDKIAGRMTCQYKCNHNPYFDGCRLDINEHSIETNILSISEDGISFEVESINGFPDDWFKNGTIRNNSDKQERMIIEQKGNKLTMLYPIYGFKKNDNVRLSFGCDRLPTTCNNKFNNLKDYRGEPFVPETSPFLTDVQEEEEIADEDWEDPFLIVFPEPEDQ